MNVYLLMYCFIRLLHESPAGADRMLGKFARAARQRIRHEGGGYCRDHLRALAQRVEVAEGEVRIMGSKSRLLQVLIGKMA